MPESRVDEDQFRRATEAIAAMERARNLQRIREDGQVEDGQAEDGQAGEANAPGSVAEATARMKPALMVDVRTALGDDLLPRRSPIEA